MEPDPWGSRPSTPPQSYGQAGSRPAAPVALPPRGRPGLIAFIAVLVEIVLVAAFGNQGVTKEVVKAAAKTHNATTRDLLFSGLTFNWRFSSGGVLASERYWASQLLLLGVLFVLTFLLVLAVVRGAITFGRAFFGTWMAVLVATLLGAASAGAVYDSVRQRKPRTFAEAVWNSSGVSSFTFVAGLGLGFVVALITALVAVATRRPAAVATPEYYDELPPEQVPPPQPPPYHGEPTTSELPSLRKEPVADQRTQVISRDEPTGGGGAWPSAAAAGIGAGAGAAGVAGAYEAHESRTGDRADTRDEPTAAWSAQGQERPHEDVPTSAMPVPGGEPRDEPTSAFTPTDTDDAQGRPAGDQSGAGDGQQVPTNQTVQLPRFEPGQEPWTSRGTTPDHPATRSDDTNELPRTASSAPPQTHFPRPPNDEDFGPDHDD